MVGYSTWNPLAPHQTLLGVGRLRELEESMCQSCGDCALGLVSSQETSAPAAELLCADRTAQLRITHGSLHRGGHNLSALPELHPTVALLSQVPSAWGLFCLT